jgi:hypothetical protein
MNVSEVISRLEKIKAEIGGDAQVLSPYHDSEFLKYYMITSVHIEEIGERMDGSDTVLAAILHLVDD